TGVMDDPDTTIAEIFDLVDRSLALGPGAVIDVAAMEAPTFDPDAPPREAVDPGAAHLGAAPVESAEAGGSMSVVDPELAEEPAASTRAEDAAAFESPEETVHSPRVVLLLSTLPPRLRRRLLDALAAPLVTLGRRALFLVSDPSDAET